LDLISSDKSTGLLDICDRLSKIVAGGGDDTTETSSLMKAFKEGLGVDAARLAKSIEVSDQTLYRWLNGTSRPRQGNISRLKQLVKDGDRPQVFDEPQHVRIGVSRFWDMALISTFEMLFAAYNIKPRFVTLDAWHDDAHEAFRFNEIDVAIHNDFTVLYDDMTPGRLGLVMSHPLFSYQGHHIFARKDFLTKAEFSNEIVIRALASGRLKSGLVPRKKEVVEEEVEESLARSLKEHKDALRAILRLARIGVERGTDLELTFRMAYALADLPFEEAVINCDHDNMPINGEASNPYLATTAEAFKAFQDGRVDLFCGGWPQYYYLKQLDPDPYCVVLPPDELDIQSFNGLITTVKFSETSKQLLQVISNVWFRGIGLFRHWTAEASDRDPLARKRAVTELGAVLNAVEARMGAATGHTSLLPSNLIRTTAINATVARVVECTDIEKTYDMISDILAMDKEERERRVADWASQICRFDSFFSDPEEAKEAFKRWKSNVEIQQQWRKVHSDYVKYVHFGL
jgi:hypothetical protein